MPRRIHLKPHLTDDELHDRYRRADDPVERSHWHFLWLLASGMTATAVAAVAGPHPEGDRWCGRTVATWLSKRLGRQVGRQLGWRYLRRLGAHWLKPRPRHVQADPQAQTEFRVPGHLQLLLLPPHSPPAAAGRAPAVR